MRSKYELKKESARVNELLRAEALELGLGTKKSLKRLADSKGDLKAFSYWAELEFREFIRRRLEQHNYVATVLINEGARLLGLSPATTKRYFEKLRAYGGPFVDMGEVVIINVHYRPPEEDEYWLDPDEPKDKHTKG